MCALVPILQLRTPLNLHHQGHGRDDATRVDVCIVWEDIAILFYAP